MTKLKNRFYGKTLQDIVNDGYLGEFISDASELSGEDIAFFINEMDNKLNFEEIKYMIELYSDKKIPTDKEFEIINEEEFKKELLLGIKKAKEDDSSLFFAIAKFNNNIKKEDINEVELMMQGYIPIELFSSEEILIDLSDQLDCLENELEYRITNIK